MSVRKLWLGQKCFIFLLGMGFYSLIKGTFLLVNIKTQVQYDTQGEEFIGGVIRGYTTMSPIQDVESLPECHEDVLTSRKPFEGCGTECEKITCKALLFGNGTRPEDQWMYDAAEKHTKNHLPQFYTDRDYINLTRNCEEFKRSRGYFIEPMSAVEAGFPIAYNLLVHRDIEQIERLLRAIYHPQNSYCIHLDGNAPQVMQEAIRGIAACFANVFLPSVTEKIVYAGTTRLQADINCMRDHLKSNIKWKYLFNIAGQSFPLKTNLELVKILKTYKGANDIEGIHGHRVLRSRFMNEWIEKDGKMNKTGNKNPPPPHDIDIVRGSAYGVFSLDFVDYIVNNEWARDLLEWSKRTYSPDEHYWSTLHHTYSNPHMKPPGSYSGNPNDKPWLAVYVKWGGVDKCYGVWKRGVCVFGVKDLPTLINQKHMFCNKFYQDFRPLSYDCLEAYIRHRTLCPKKLDTTYYEALPFIPKPRTGIAAWFH